MTNKRYQIIGIITGTLAVVIAFLTFLFGDGILGIGSTDNKTGSQAENRMESDDLTNKDKTTSDSSDNSQDDESTSPDEADNSGSNIEPDTSDMEDGSALIESTETTPSNMIVVPNVVGMEQDEATRLIEEIGLQFQVWWIEGDAESEPYYILEQSIPEGSIVAPGTLIRLQLTSTRP